MLSLTLDSSLGQLKSEPHTHIAVWFPYPHHNEVLSRNPYHIDLDHRPMSLCSNVQLHTHVYNVCSSVHTSSLTGIPGGARWAAGVCSSGHASAPPSARPRQARRSPSAAAAACKGAALSAPPHRETPAAMAAAGRCGSKAVVQKPRPGAAWAPLAPPSSTERAWAAPAAAAGTVATVGVAEPLLPCHSQHAAPPGHHLTGSSARGTVDGGSRQGLQSRCPPEATRAAALEPPGRRRTAAAAALSGTHQSKQHPPWQRHIGIAGVPCGAQPLPPSPVQAIGGLAAAAPSPSSTPYAEALRSVPWDGRVGLWDDQVGLWADQGGGAAGVAWPAGRLRRAVGCVVVGVGRAGAGSWILPPVRPGAPE